MSNNGTGAGSPRDGSGGFVPPTPAELDAILDQYKFIELIGRGGMGAVYKARQKSLDRLVAVKILPPHLTCGAEEEGFHFSERFQREARAMAKLSHPNIVGVYNFGQSTDGQFYFVMEYIEGTDLSNLIRSGEITPAHITSWMSQICGALQYAHGKGIVHRDIKPANIMITRQGQVKVADFGLAKLTGPDRIETRLTMTNMAMGTPDYVAPEVLEAGAEVDHRVDLYAVGVMLFEMLTGKVPRGSWKMPSIQIPGLDPRFDDLIERAMEADREKRYQHASEISAAIHQIATTPPKPKAANPRKLVVGDTGPGHSRPQPQKNGPGHPAPRQKAKAPAALITGLALAALLAAAGGLYLFSREKSPPIVAEAPVKVPDTPKAAPISRPEPAPKIEPAPAPAPEKVPLSRRSAIFGGHRYEFVPDSSISQPDAAAKAKAMGGHLAAIGSEAEQDWIKSEFARMSPQILDLLWVDGRIDSKATGWKLHDGSEAPVFKWGEGRPLYGRADQTLSFPGFLAFGRFDKDYGIEDCPPSPEHWSDRIAGFLVEWAEPEPVAFGPSRYQLMLDQTVSFSASIEKAKTLGGHLATIPDRETDEWIDRTFRNLIEPGKSYWLGAQKEGWTNQWKWITGEPFAYSKWPVNAPGGHIPHHGMVWHRSAGEDDPAPQGWWRQTATSGGFIDGYLVEWDLVNPSKPASAAPPLTANPPSAPLPESSTDDPVAVRLTGLEKAFLATFEERVASAHDAAVSNLNRNYMDRLDRDIATASKAGKLDEALALRDERTQVETHGTIPSGEGAVVVASLQPLRKTYRETVTKLLAQRDQLAAPLYENYDRALAAYQDELTRAGELDQAARLKAVRAQIAERRESSQASAKIIDSPGPSLAVSQILPDPPRASQQDIRALAEWILEMKGGITIAKGPINQAIKVPADLPKGNLRITGISLPRFNNDEPALKFLTTLSGLTDLENFSIGAVYTGFPVESLRSLAKLQSLSLNLGTLGEGGFAHLSGLKQLTTLRLNKIAGFTGTGLAYLNDGISSLALDSSSHLSAEGLAHLARFRKMQTLSFESCPGLQDEMLKPLAALTELEILVVSRTPLEGSFLAYLPNNSKLTSLPANGLANFKEENLVHIARAKKLEETALPSINWPRETMAALGSLGSLREVNFYAPFTGEGLTGVDGFRSLKVLYLRDCPITDAGWAGIASAMPNVEQIYFSTSVDPGVPVSAAAMGEHLGRLKVLTHFGISGDRATDQWMPGVAKLKNLTHLNLGAETITDAGLVFLKDLPVNYINLRGAGVTDTGIPTLKSFSNLKSVSYHGRMTPEGSAELDTFLANRMK